MQEQFTQMRSKMEAAEVTGTAGGGLVTVVLTGDHKMKQVKIKPECVDKEDVEGLQDLIKAAYQDALKKLEAEAMPDMGAFKTLMP